MSFNKLDFHILIGSLIMIVLLSFVAPAVGMTGSAVSTQSMPEFSVDTNYFTYVNQPDAPNPDQPDSGMLNASSSTTDDYTGSIQTYLGRNQFGNRTFLVAVPNDEVNIRDVEALHNDNDDNHTFTSNGEEAGLLAGGFDIDVRAINITTGTYEYQIVENPANEVWWSGIPIVSGVADAIGGIVSMIAYVVDMIFFVIATILIAGGNTLAAIVDIAIFILSLLNFIVTEYTSIINGAPSGFASIIVSIPGVLFSIQFGRIGLMFVSKVPGLG